MSTNYLIAKSTGTLFEDAKRRGFWHRLRRKLSHRSTHLAYFDDWYSTTQVTTRVDWGIHTIPISDIIGSVGRVDAFDSNFMPLDNRVEQRWRRLLHLHMVGVILPPIEVYQTTHGYYVIDGNHRVSISRFLGVDYIDAHVIQLEVISGEPG